jgi:hypothetical protein
LRLDRRALSTLAQEEMPPVRRRRRDGAADQVEPRDLRVEVKDADRLHFQLVEQLDEPPNGSFRPRDQKIKGGPRA